MCECVFLLLLLVVCSGTSCFIAVARNKSHEESRIQLLAFKAIRVHTPFVYITQSCALPTTTTIVRALICRYLSSCASAVAPSSCHTCWFSFSICFMRIVFFVYSLIYLFNGVSCGYLAAKCVYIYINIYLFIVCICLCAHLFMCVSGNSYLSFAYEYFNTAHIKEN